ncbi:MULTISPECIES: hypothetical protein [unclassified Chryseobacterium]|uniref:hypothetical protein n=1 Tax=unclassified Chryseobacterium TaxID=2593645 RepID=UPI00100C218B|nr:MULTISPECIES: hypothetical protein [unclassified Chryseobacterium]RXM51560.1 hypothetical protein BOQ64_11515 [Chryseobacterium sp. CH25]RXM67132.1 hypothetical protein BOQ60_04225 [Chryseobacterium sp. CH1]
MQKINIIPIIITLLQLAGIWHVWYTYLYKDGQIPQSFIELNILAVFSICVLVLIIFRYFKTRKKLEYGSFPPVFHYSSFLY